MVEPPWFGTIEVSGKLWGWALLRRLQRDGATSGTPARIVDSLVFYNPSNLTERVHCRVPDDMSGKPDESLLRQLLEQCHSRSNAP